MIRIIYSWKVAPTQLASFIATWKQTTTKIHQDVTGARGSFMLQDEQDSSIIKTVARWDSLNDWKRFWKDSNTSQMQSLHDLGERVSVEIYKEIDDFTR